MRWQVIYCRDEAEVREARPVLFPGEQNALVVSSAFSLSNSRGCNLEILLCMLVRELHPMPDRSAIVFLPQK